MVDDDGTTLPAGHEGHLLVKGESFATGYWCETCWSRRTFEGVWACTGDIYVESDDGYFTYLGRSDDMLVCRGNGYRLRRSKGFSSRIRPYSRRQWWVSGTT